LKTKQIQLFLLGFSEEVYLHFTCTQLQVVDYKWSG
jgi:hypothetical protein